MTSRRSRIRRRPKPSSSIGSTICTGDERAGCQRARAVCPPGGRTARHQPGRTPDGPDRARQDLVEARARTLTEQKQYRQVFASANLLTDDAGRLAAYAAVDLDRGLSSDTSIAVDFALDQAIAGLRAGQHVAPASVHRLAIVGPGLDFTDKAEGYDFYPLQTIQPFALIDSLKRHGLAASSGVAVTTFDISSRVTQHLERARDRARAGDSYVVQVPLDEDSADRQWLPAMVDFWRRFGDQIGTAVDPIRPPPGAASVRMRALQVPAKLVGGDRSPRPQHRHRAAGAR